ncbi:hypothetical protein ABW19_dt0203776 [Dactylella cylindrospora]|nr:hypothetical protein ABW19_dt0203776 [Dactylella cylindrospora]
MHGALSGLMLLLLASKAASSPVPPGLIREDVSPPSSPPAYSSLPPFPPSYDYNLNTLTGPSSQSNPTRNQDGTPGTERFHPPIAQAFTAREPTIRRFDELKEDGRELRSGRLGDEIFAASNPPRREDVEMLTDSEITIKHGGWTGIARSAEGQAILAPSLNHPTSSDYVIDEIRDFRLGTNYGIATSISDGVMSVKFSSNPRNPRTHIEIDLCMARIWHDRTGGSEANLELVEWKDPHPETQSLMKEVIGMVPENSPLRAPPIQSPRSQFVSYSRIIIRSGSSDPLERDIWDAIYATREFQEVKKMEEKFPNLLRNGQVKEVHLVSPSLDGSATWLFGIIFKFERPEAPNNLS